MSLFQSKYERLPQASESLQLNLDLSKWEVSIQAQKRRSWLHWLLHTISVIVILSILLTFPEKTAISRAKCWDMYNYYSPVNEALSSLEYKETRFNGSLWYQSPFKGPPNKEVEQTWQAAMQYGMIGVSAEDMRRVGHNLTTAVQFPADVKAEAGNYLATTIGVHAIHCLHYVWQDHHSGYFADTLRKMQEIPEMYERHYEHCVDYIRQSLMCNFDTGLVTYDWVLEHQNPTPNSNARHKCVDHERLQAWFKDRAVEVPEGFEWKQPEGQESLDWNP